MKTTNGNTTYVIIVVFHYKSNVRVVNIDLEIVTTKIVKITVIMNKII